MGLFFIALALLIIGYFVYGTIVEKVWGVDVNRKTPAIKYADGVDYMTMPLWRIFLIQFLNIAGLGPVFGAVLGAVYGPVCLLWIVFGCIFAGGVHDFLSGMLSVRFKGQTVVYVTEHLFGKWFKILFLTFYLLLLFLLGTNFAINPAVMLADITHSPLLYWVIAVFGYYFLATLLPIDIIIGKVYPYFAALLIIMTITSVISLICSGNVFYPDLTFKNLYPNGESHIFPMLFVTVACGAVSGFHATQVPVTARCIPNEKYGRIIFYGSMVAEGIIALIWATLGISFYQHTGGLLNAINQLGEGGVVSHIATSMLGKWGGILTILSVVVLAITSGDSAFRSIRLSIADFMKWSQSNVKNRLALSIVVIGIGVILSTIDLTTLWIYFGWANQALSFLVLWTLTYYLAKKRKFYFITLIPALFMTAVCISYILQAEIGFRLNSQISNILAIISTLICLIIFVIWKNVFYKRKIVKK